MVSSLCDFHAGVAQLVEHQLPKLRVAGSSPVSRSGSLVDLVIEEPETSQRRVRDNKPESAFEGFLLPFTIGLKEYGIGTPFGVALEKRLQQAQEGDK